jgi:hypothetical protein
MKNKRKYCAGNIIRQQNGLALTFVLVLLAIGMLIITPLLSYMSTGLGAGTVFQNKSNELYAADAGIEDGLWQVKTDHIKTFTSPQAYDPYDFSTQWDYALPELVNGENTNVAISNIWIPSNIPAPADPEFAGNIIDNGKLVVTGSVSGSLTYQIKITYYKEASDPDLEIQTLGIWLPPGFAYVTGSSNLEDNIMAPYYPVSVTVNAHDSGQAVIWTFDNDTLFAGSAGPPVVAPFPGVDSSQNPMTGTITFNFTAQQPGSIPSAVAWVTTAGVSDIPYSWNADNKVFHIVSTAGDTQVESYTIKNELRQIQSSIAGDYYATGNSVLSDTDGDHRRETPYNPSSAAITSGNIPADADVAAAYLYWTGWKNDNSVTLLTQLNPNPDPCQNFNNWTAGSAWSSTYYAGRFTGYTYGKPSPGRNLTLTNSLDLSSYSAFLVTISWNQYESGTISSGDGLDFAVSNDGGVTWSSNIVAFRDDNPTNPFSYTIPTQYLTSGFKIKFYLVGFGGSGRYCYIDNIKITAKLPDTSVVFKIDNGDGSGPKQVYLDGSGQPQQGAQGLTASKSQVVENYSGTTIHGFSYSSFRDVTNLVRTYSQAPVAPNTNWPGYATYWVGGIYADTLGSTGNEDEWAYACWSLVVIYTSPNTQGHQIYLYDKFTYSNQDTTNGVNVDFDHDGQPGGTISGFIVPQPIAGEVNAGKISTFAGEGDVWYPGDYVAINGTRLWDGTNTTGNSENSPNNVFNSTSMGLGTYDGIDIDTLGIDPPNGQYITWASNLLRPGDTSARIDMVTYQDVWNMVYIIISFRSSVTTGGSISYLIRG